MKQILEHIRNKPHEHRQRLVWICVGVVAALLLLTWALVGNSSRGDAGNFFQTLNEGVEQGRDQYESSPLK